MEKQQKLKEFLSDNEHGIILSNINRIIERITSANPKISFSQHMLNVLRPAGELQGDPWYWKNEKVLKKLEVYERKICEHYNPETGEWDLDDEPIDEEWLNDRNINK